MSESSPKQKWHEKVRIVEAQTELGKMYYLVDENYDFISLVKEFLDMIQARSVREVSPNTIRSYCYHLWYFIVFLKINNLSINDIDGNPYVLTQFKLWLKNPYRFFENVEIFSFDCNLQYEEDELTISTQNQYIDRVSSLCLWLKATNRIKENPVIYRNIPVTQPMKDRDLLAHTRHNKNTKINILKSRVPKIIPKVVDQKIFKKFLSSVNLLRDKIILLCLKEGGFRANELLGVHLEDIDFAEQGLYVRFRTNNINGARAKAGYGKERFVNLSTDLMSLIDNYISSEWVESNPSTDFLFVVVNSNVPAVNGNPMTKSTLDSLFKYYSLKVFGYTIENNIKKPKNHIYPHQLRHTHVTELARAYINKGEEINWKFISARVGHSSVLTTMELYSHLTKEDYKREYMRMQEYRETQRKE